MLKNINADNGIEFVSYKNFCLFIGNIVLIEFDIRVVNSRVGKIEIGDI